MAFLDNSGDIIIDAVLTDTGRYRLAKGDGKFNIKKFALGDDEVDYALYNVTAASGQQDLEIMQTPILEAFTNNASSLKSKLITIPRNNILYMPVLKANNEEGGGSLNRTLSMYVVAVDSTTETALIGSSQPYLYGENFASGIQLRVDQGIDNAEQSPNYTIPKDLLEDEYIVQIDNRLGNIVSKKVSKTSTSSAADVVFIDDDNIANYNLSLGTDKNYVTMNGSTATAGEVIAGPRGTILTMCIQASIDLNSSNYLFTELGGTCSIGGISGPFKYIDSTVRIQGATTGAQIDLPVRFVKS